MHHYHILPSYGRVGTVGVYFGFTIEKATLVLSWQQKVTQAHGWTYFPPISSEYFANSVQAGTAI